MRNAIFASRLISLAKWFTDQEVEYELPGWQLVFHAELPADEWHAIAHEFRPEEEIEGKMIKRGRVIPGGSLYIHTDHAELLAIRKAEQDAERTPIEPTQPEGAD